jgi:8-oxo-dGTP pyrophosphatase MutT (NUDIX family)
MSKNSALVIKAAGGIISRRNETGEQVFAIIHKRKYGEWCLPKGKLQADEDWRDAAVREVNEETGSPVRVLEPAAVNSYFVKGVPKIVVFFAMEASGSAVFRPSHEVDRVEWLNEAGIRGKLSHAGERRAFDEIIQALDVKEDRKS